MMPHEVSIDVAGRRVASRWHGVVEEDEFSEYIATVWSNSDHSGFDELLDLSGVDEIRLDADAVERLTRRSLAVADPEARARSALVAPEALVYGLSRMYVSMREVNEPHEREWLVTADLAQAEAWLAASPASARR